MVIIDKVVGTSILRRPAVAASILISLQLQPLLYTMLGMLYVCHSRTDRADKRQGRKSVMVRKAPFYAPGSMAAATLRPS